MSPDVKVNIKAVLGYLASEILAARRKGDKSRGERLMIAFKILSEEYEKNT
ncbi:hypothetical protein J7K52_01630 [Candidatus Bathyarchaeota archaeon]|nr:hypothetical protein [Candidatus Bathyarchaeota archaeon]